MKKKYELTSETKEAHGATLYRIRAVRNFGTVKAGDLGGWIEKEANLSKSDNAWVCDNAEVYGDARVYGNAMVCDNAEVYGNAEVYDDAMVCNNARVYGNAEVYGNARVYGNVEVCGNARVCDNAEVYGDALVCNNAVVYDNAEVYGDAAVCGNAEAYGNARVCGIAQVSDIEQIFWISNIGSRHDTTTFFQCQDGKIRVKTGCFYGDLEAFAAAIQKTHGDNKYAQVYRLAIEQAKAQIGEAEPEADYV